MRDYFPFLNNCIYLNTPYTAPLSQPLLDWRKKEEQLFFELGDHYKKHNEKKYIEEARKELALFTNSSIEHTFICGNFSSAFQQFLMFLSPTTSFLIFEEEYPSLTQIVEGMGFLAHKIPLSSSPEKEVQTAIKNNKIDVLALSAIQYESGLFFDMETLSQLKKEYPNLIILVDGTQFLGAELFSFAESPVDAIFGSCYKWLMAGHGTGYAIYKPSLLHHHGFSLKKIVQAHDKGQLSISAIGSLMVALKLLSASSFSSLIQHKKRLSILLKKELEKRELLAKEIADRKHHSSIFNLALSREQYEKLLAKNVRCIWRGQGVRIGIHHYNTETEIVQFLALLDEFN